MHGCSSVCKFSVFTKYLLSFSRLFNRHFQHILCEFRAKSKVVILHKAQNLFLFNCPKCIQTRDQNET